MRRPRTSDRRDGTAELAGTGVDRSLIRTGVDRSLIRWTLSLSPRQRLQVLQEHLRLVRALRRDVAAE